MQITFNTTDGFSFELLGAPTTDQDRKLLAALLDVLATVVPAKACTVVRLVAWGKKKTQVVYAVRTCAGLYKNYTNKEVAQLRLPWVYHAADHEKAQQLYDSLIAAGATAELVP